MNCSTRLKLVLLAENHGTVGREGPEHLLQVGLLATLHRAHVASAGPRDSGATADSVQTELGRRGDHRVSVDRAGEVEKLPGQCRHRGAGGETTGSV